MTRPFRVACALAAACALGLAAAPVSATEITAGWLRSDIGLDQSGNGLFVGVGGNWPLGAGPFDVSAGGSFLRKRGVQPLLVGSPDLGLVRSDAQVTLTCLQPEASVGWNLPAGPLGLRPYAGGAVSIKLGETWDRVAGALAREYGYDDVDVVVHAGLQVRVAGRFLVDARYSRGLLGQVVSRDGTGFTKAIDPLTGAKLPEDGDTVAWVQVGAGVAF